MKYASKSEDGRLELTLRLPPWMGWLAGAMGLPFALAAAGSFVSGEAGAGVLFLVFCGIPALLLLHSFVSRRRWTFDRNLQTATCETVFGRPLWKKEHRLQAMQVVHVTRIGQSVLGLVLDRYPVRIRGPELEVNTDLDPLVSWRMAVELADYLDLPLVDGSTGLKRRPPADAGPEGAGRTRVSGDDAGKTYVLPRPGLSLGDGALLAILLAVVGFLTWRIVGDSPNAGEARIWVPLALILAFLGSLAAVVLRAAFLRDRITAGPEGVRVERGLLWRRATTAAPGEIRHVGPGLRSGNDLRSAAYLVFFFALTAGIAAGLSAAAGRKGEVDIDPDDDVSGDGVLILRGPRHWIELGRRMRPAERQWLEAELRRLLQIPLPPEPKRGTVAAEGKSTAGPGAEGAAEGGEAPGRSPARPRRRPRANP